MWAFPKLRCSCGGMHQSAACGEHMLIMHACFLLPAQSSTYISQWLLAAQQRAAAACMLHVARCHAVATFVCVGGGTSHGTTIGLTAMRAAYRACPRPVRPRAGLLGQAHAIAARAHVVTPHAGRWCECQRVVNGMEIMGQGVWSPHCGLNHAGDTAPGPTPCDPQSRVAGRMVSALAAAGPGRQPSCDGGMCVGLAAVLQRPDDGVE